MDAAGKAKAYLRRAIAWEHMGEFNKSLRDLESVQKLESGLIYKNETFKIYSRVSRAAQLDQIALRKDPRPMSFMTKHQTLRLNLGEMLPSTLSYGLNYFIRLNITNEFGLWSREIHGAAPEGYDNGEVPAHVSCKVHRCWGGSMPQLTVTPSPEGIGADGRVCDTYRDDCG